MLKIEKTVLPSPEQWEIIIEGMRNPKNSWDRMDSDYRKVASRMCGECGKYKLDDESDACEGCELNYLDCSHFILGPNDYDLMMRLAKGGSVDAKYRRMIPVYITLTAPLYWWKEMDRYQVGTVFNSCSTMHKIQAKEFTLDDFSHEHLFDIDTEDDIPEDDLVQATYWDTIDDRYEEYWDSIEILKKTIEALNLYRKRFLECEAKLKRTDLTEAERKHVTAQKKRYWWQMIQLLPTSYNQKRTIMLNYEVLVGIYKWRKNHKLDEWHTFCDWIEQLPYSELITGEQTETET